MVTRVHTRARARWLRDSGRSLTTQRGVAAVRNRAAPHRLAAEVKVCQSICDGTGGLHRVIRDKKDFATTLNEHCTPPPSTEQSKTKLLPVGCVPARSCPPHPRPVLCRQLPATPTTTACAHT